MTRGDDAPEYHPDLTRARFMPRTAVTAATRPVMRAFGRIGAARAPRDGEVLDLDGGARVRLHWPRTTAAGSSALTAHPPLPAALHLHGGGLIIGSARQSDAMCRRLADQLGIAVASVDYRMPPQHPYPAALDDAQAALEAVAAHPRVDAERIVVMGESAGGGLAAALAARAADGRTPPLAGQVLTYPMLDDRTARDGAPDPAGLRLWNGTSNRLGWGLYLGDVADAPPADAVPARREDLSGLPPTWITVGTLDLFHAEDVAYAERLGAAGVPCELIEVPGAYHGFDVAEPAAGVSRDIDTQRTAAIARMLGVASR